MAEAELKNLYANPRDIRLEAAILNEENNSIEVLFSYVLEQQDKVNVDDTNASNPILALTQLLRFNRIYKTFMLDSHSLNFKGLKAYKEI